MAVGPVGQRPLEQSNVAAPIVQLSVQSPVNPHGQSQLIRPSNKDCCTDSCVKKIPVIGWVVDGIVSIYSWFVKTVLCCCARAPAPPAPSAQPVNSPALQVGPNPVVNANPVPIEIPAPVQVQQPVPVAIPAPQPQAIEENAVQRFQEFVNERMGELAQQEGPPQRVPLSAVPENPYGEDRPVRFAIVSFPTYEESLLSEFSEEDPADAEAIENAREFAAKAEEIAAKIQEIKGIRSRFEEADNLGHDQAEIRAIQRELLEQRAAGRALMQQLSQLNTDLNERVAHRADALLTAFNNDLFEPMLRPLAESVQVELGLNLPLDDRGLRAVVLVQQSKLKNKSIGQIIEHAKKLSEELKKSRIAEIVAASALEEGITALELLQRTARMEDVEYEALSEEDKARIALRIVHDGNPPDIILEIPAAFNIEAMRRIANFSEEFNNAPDKVTMKLRDQIGMNEDVFPLAQNLADRFLPQIPHFGQQARHDRGQMQARILNLREQINEENREEILAQVQPLEEQFEVLQQDDDDRSRILAVLGENGVGLVRLMRIVALVRKVDARAREIEEHEELLADIEQIREVNEARVQNDDGILFHKFLIRHRLEELRGAEREAFHQSFINREELNNGSSLSIQQGIMAAAAAMVFVRRPLDYMMPYENRIRQLQTEFRALSPEDQNQVILNLYAHDANGLQNPQAISIWEQCRALGDTFEEDVNFKVSLEAAVINHNAWCKQEMRREVPAFAALNEADQDAIYASIYSDQTLSQDIPRILRELGPEIRRLRIENPDHFNGPLDAADDYLERVLCANSAALNDLDWLSQIFIFNYVRTPRPRALNIDQRMAAVNNALQACREYIARQDIA